MRLRYAQLIGKRVLQADGTDMGRLRDLVAEPDGNELRITGLLVGPIELLHRMGFGVAGPATLKWDSVERIDDAIHVRKEDGDGGDPLP